MTSLFVSQRLVTFVMTPDAGLLATLKDLVEAGKVKPLLDRRYALDQVGDALRHVGEGHGQGQTVLTVAG